MPCVEPMYSEYVVSVVWGDALFLPHHWWHTVHAAKENDSVSISLNCWFDPSRELSSISNDLPYPPTPEMHIYLSRQIDTLLGDGVSPDERAATARAMHAYLDGSRTAADGADESLDEARAGKRNFVMHVLAALYGERGAAQFFRTFHDERRWSRLKRTCFAPGLEGKGGRGVLS